MTQKIPQNDTDCGVSWRDFDVPVIVLVVLAVIIFLCTCFVADSRDEMQRRFSDIHSVLSDNAKSNNDNPFINMKLTQAQIEARDSVSQRIKTKKDELQWHVLAKALMKIVKKKGEDTAAPVYTKAIYAFDGKLEQAEGYMFPLDKSGSQRHFLLSPYPISCPYCLPAGPQELIEVRVKNPVPFTYDSIKVSGIFHLLKGKDIAEGMFYRMTDASVHQ